MKFKPGDRVYCGTDMYKYPVNSFGTVTQVPPDSGSMYGVAFDSFKGHDCDGTAPLFNGRYIFEQDLVLESVYKSKLYKLLNEEQHELNRKN